MSETENKRRKACEVCGYESATCPVCGDSVCDFCAPVCREECVPVLIRRVVELESILTERDKGGGR